MSFLSRRGSVPPLFDQNGGPLDVRSADDLVGTRLVDLHGLNPYWQSLITRMHFAVAQRYPTGVSAVTRVIDVDQYDSGAHHARAAHLSQDTSFPSPEYLVWNRAYFGDRPRLKQVLDLFGRDVATRTHAPTDRPDLSLVLHEVLHPVFQLAVHMRDFRQDFADAVSPALGVRWTEKTYNDETVLVALHEQLGRYATLGFEEAGVEALANGILHGDQATPVGAATQAVFDKWFRFDSPGVEALAASVLGRHGAPATSDRRATRNGLRELGTGPAREWKPLDLSGRNTNEGEFHAYSLDAQALQPPTPELPDAFFGNIMARLPKGDVLSWRHGGMTKGIPTAFLGPFQLENPPRSHVVNAPAFPLTAGRRSVDGPSIGF